MDHSPPALMHFDGPSPRFDSLALGVAASGSFMANRLRCAASLILGSLLSGCLAVVPSDLPQNDELHVLQRAACKGLSNTFDCARAMEALIVARATTPKLRRQEGALEFTLADGRLTRFIDDTGEDPVLYSYVGFVKSPALHVIEMQFFEGNSFVLVNDATGMKTYVHGLPIPSPCGKRVLATSIDLEAGYGPTAIGIWEKQAHGLEMEYYHSLGSVDWGPASARWHGESRIVFRRQGLGGVDVGSGQLEFRNGIWMLTHH